ncbi:7TM GPCR serpentine receptor class x (Srx) domain-containing protein [Caenorhabditis elegans]|uniref:7TM GPCR serpentine receptor class x (Srx) domain-containing protein n=1 Tax=Caenorhabditis elegans TaxID=6239 RepID=Q20290_CAEEL|nr:7TM GPCR serpentine receptor class x (Srx) domain-containing protein [Caenorhabditis elegans]CCD71043.1 7TM GPCR serpentine receptor class x (Srx) domain-containing protein [Caenorhabditis elegans]|eukprot:NP_495380.2 Serpentine Receptor, class X [Caenorhabditis elegans]
MYFHFNSTIEIQHEQRTCAAILLALISLVGGAVNAYIASGFMFGIKFRGGFFIFSISKAFSNILTCSLVFFWLVPAVFARDNLVSNYVNMLLSQLLLFGLYIQGTLTQCYLALNRFATICFVGSVKRENADMIALGVLTSWFAAIIWTLLGYPECTCYFSSEHLTFIYFDDCHIANYQLQLYCAFVLMMIFNMLNVISFLIICCGGAKSVSFSCRNAPRRKQRNAKMFIQCMAQSLLYIIDVFLISSLHSGSFGDILVALPSMAFLALFDGLIMLLCNNDIQPACIASKNLQKKSSVISISASDFR